MAAKAPGKVREKLAQLLQKSFPTKGEFALTWRAEWLHPAAGAYRTSGIDCFRWEGSARHFREDGTFYTAMSVGSYETMTSLIKANRLRISSSGEVVPDDDVE
jgi:hypothetical protein